MIGVFCRTIINEWRFKMTGLTQTKETDLSRYGRALKFNSNLSTHAV